MYYATSYTAEGTISIHDMQVETQSVVKTYTQSVAHKVKKAYIGDANGVAREWWNPVFQDELVDFEYVDNYNYTATIIDWKGTLNGVPSTELIIPANPKVCL